MAVRAWLAGLLAPILIAALVTPIVVVALTVVVAFSLPVRAAEPAASPTARHDLLPEHSIRLITLGTDQGLSQSSVYTITQDNYGFIWLGTSDGLNRYDGHNLRIWRRGEEGLSRDSVQSLCRDQQGALWVGLFDGGVHRYDPQRNQLGPVHPGEGGLQGPLPGRVSSCLDDGVGNVWFATDTGLSRYVHDSNQFEHWPLTAATDTESEHRLLALQRDVNGKLLVLSSSGLYRFDEQLQLLTAPSTLAARTRFTALLVDGDNVLLGTSNAGLWRWQQTTNLLTALPLPQFAEPIEITALLRDRDGRLWVGTETEGVLLQEKPNARWQQISHRPGQPDSLPDNHVRALFQSREGVIWVGTWLAGVSRFDPLQTSFHIVRTDPSRPDSLPTNSVRSLLAETDVLWVGSDGGGLSRSRDNGRHFEHFRHHPNRIDSISDGHIRFIYRDRTSRLWLGTENGLNQLQNDRVSRIHLSPEASGSDAPIRLRAIAEDRDGSLWLGTFGGGLLRYFPAQQRTESMQANREQDGALCGNRVVALAFDLDGSLLVGTDDGGLCRRLVDGKFERLLPIVFSVWALHATTDAIWIGSYGDGLLKYHRRSQRIHRFDHRHGITNDVIYAILPDDQGRFWLSSNDGLFSFDPTRERADAYTVSAGLQDREFNSGAAARGPDGRLYFGGIRGFNWFDPAEVALNMMPPRSTITRLEVMQRESPLPVHATEHVALAAGENTLSLEFSAQHYSTPDGNRYRYRLLPAEPDWNEISGGQYRVHYSQLPPGDYQFELRAGSAAGVWDPDTRQLSISVASPRWSSRLAYVSYAAIALLMTIALLMQQRRIRRQERQSLMVLTDQVEQRTQELQQKNSALEQLNQELQQANLRLETISLTDPLTGLGNRRLLFRYLEKDAPAIIRRHQDAVNLGQPAHQADLLFFLIDIDHFKRINDSFGHAIGDEVLVNVKARLQHICREQDFLVRYGGEEFLLVRRYSERSISPQLAERIRSVIGDQPFTLSNGGRLSVTCSIGYAAYPLVPEHVNAFSCEQVLQVADCLLYAAKHSGRNHWVGATSAREVRAELLLTRLRENGASAVSTGDIDLQSSLRSLKRLRWRPLDIDRLSDLSID